MKYHRALNWKISTFILPFIFFGTFLSFGQVTRVELIKSKVSSEDYETLEKVWKPIHQARLNQRQIYGWYLIKKLFTGTEDPYDYIIVTIYPSLEALQYPLPEQIIAGYKDEFFEKTTASRDIIRTEIYDTPIVTEVFNLPRFLQVSFEKVAEEKEEKYLNIEEEIWKPANESLIKNKHQATFSVYRQLYPGGYSNDYNYVTLRGFSDLQKVLQEPPQGWKELLTSVHPDKDPVKILSNTAALRQQVKLELWEILLSVVPQ